MIHCSLFILYTCALNEEHVQLRPTNENKDGIQSLLMLSEQPLLSKGGLTTFNTSLCKAGWIVIYMCVCVLATKPANMNRSNLCVYWGHRGCIHTLTCMMHVQSRGRLGLVKDGKISCRRQHLLLCSPLLLLLFWSVPNRYCTGCLHSKQFSEKWVHTPKEPHLGRPQEISLQFSCCLLGSRPADLSFLGFHTAEAALGMLQTESTAGNSLPLTLQLVW